MEIALKAAWLALAAVHAAPAAVLVKRALVERLYGVAPTGDVGTLIVHRGALFLAVLAVALFAAFDASARRAAALVVAISVFGFLIIYARSGAPEGALRTIALADVAALIPLAFVAIDAARSGGASNH